MKILVINGPNINMLGIREPDIYGNRSYTDLCNMLKNYSDEKHIDLEIYQSNHEGDLVDKIQQAYNNASGIVINPAAYTHTSIAIADALASVGLPYVEVHISDINNREDFRKNSFIRKNALKTIVGDGFDGYINAIDFLSENIK